MNIVIIGTGYVGLVTGACLSETGNHVVCVDVDKNKIERLRAGDIPIYEPGLESIVKKNAALGNLSFTTELSECLNEADIVFSAVGTPSDVDGSADLKYVFSVAREVGRLLEKEIVFVTKSTVPVGTAKKVRECISATMRLTKGREIDFHVASNPEFLKEGSAVQDFMKPDRVVIGVDDEYSENLLRELYKPFVIDNENKIIVTDIPSAEMIKYASNAMLATRISFMNEIAAVCEKVGANVDNVRRGMGTDGRIGNKFLYAGCGYGGSCFPKDVKALIKTGKENGCEMSLLNAVENVNAYQKHCLYRKLISHFIAEGLYGKKVAVLGLAFKPNTDDMREAPSVVLIEELLKAGAKVKATDPIAIETAKKVIPESLIEYCSTYKETVKDADAIVLVTEWNDFRNIDWKEILELAPNLSVVIDGRNLFNRKEIEELGIKYKAIGK